MDRPNITGLTDARWQVYQVFATSTSPLTLAAVARTLKLTPSTVHQHVQWLVDKGKLLEHTGANEYAGRYCVRAPNDCLMNRE